MTHATTRSFEVPLQQDPEPGSPGDSTAETRQGRAPFGWTGTLIDAVVCAAIVLLGIAIGPGMLQPEMQPKRAVLILVLPVGVAALTSLVRGRDGAAIAAIGFLIWATIASLTSEAPWSSVLGVINQHQSVLMFASSLSIWALARLASCAGRSLIAWSVVGVCAVNLVVAIAQLIAKPNGILDLHRGRSTGLVIAPIILGALACATAVWFICRYRTHRDVWSVVGLGLSTSLVGLTGTRAPLAICIAASLLAMAAARQLRFVVLPLAVAGGFAAAAVLYSYTDSEQALGERATSGGGISDRLDLWSLGIRGWVERPITGFGVGRFPAAARPLAPDEWVRRFPGDAWSDAHNLIVELLVTVGVVGLLVFLAFLLLAARQARGPLMWMSAAIALTWMVEPATLVTLPIAGALLGASTTRWPPSAVAISNRLVLGLACAGVVLCATFVVGDGAVDDVLESGLGPPLGGASVWFRNDPEVLDLIALVLAERDSGDSDLLLVALEWADTAVAADPGSVEAHTTQLEILIRLGEESAAQEILDAALVTWPNDVLILRSQFFLAISRADTVIARQAVERMCSVLGETDCDADAIVAEALEAQDIPRTEAPVSP